MKQQRSLTERLRSIFQQPATDLYIEAKLAKSGRLADLEAAGIVPTVKNPNPYDPSAQTNQHDQWWRKHPQAARQFRDQQRQREEALKRVYVGTHLDQER